MDLEKKFENVLYSFVDGNMASLLVFNIVLGIIVVVAGIVLGVKGTTKTTKTIGYACIGVGILILMWGIVQRML